MVRTAGDRNESIHDKREEGLEEKMVGQTEG